MSELSLIGPSAIFDLGNEKWLREDRALASEVYWRHVGDDLVQQLPQGDGLPLAPTRAAPADIHETFTFLSREQQATNRAWQRRGLIPDDDEGVAASAGDLQPISDAPRFVRFLAMLWDDAFESMLTSNTVEFGPICLHLFGKPNCTRVTGKNLF
jgi:hypothetical protein